MGGSGGEKTGWWWWGGTVIVGEGAKIGRELALAAAMTSVTRAWLARAASGANDQPGVYCGYCD